MAAFNLILFCGIIFSSKAELVDVMKINLTLFNPLNIEELPIIPIDVENEIPILTELTFCASVFTPHMGETHVMSIWQRINNETKHSLNFKFNSPDVGQGILQTDHEFIMFSFSTNDSVYLQDWFHICFVVKNGTYPLIILNGQHLALEYTNHKAFVFEWMTVGTLVMSIGYRGSTTLYLENYSFMISDVSLWSKALDVKTLKEISLNCKQPDEYDPDLFSWLNVMAKLKGM